MPRRTDIKRIMLIGAGPIVIGQACEFDYAGTQALKALREEGYDVVLVNSNPATIMTDPEFADATYIEPLNPETLERIIAREKPDALIPTLGGQTALNLAVALHERGTLERYGVELIGADIDAIQRAESRDLFAKAMHEVGVPLARGWTVTTIAEARSARHDLGLPLVVRPSYTLGGGGGSLVHSDEEFEEAIERGLRESPVSAVLLEESLLGWKEFELEVLRDKADNVVIICSIENIDPMGIHTGDSFTVAPALTLTDREYQRLRDAAIACIRAIGVETGGSNVQFAVDPTTGRFVIIEMNPRVSRSSALASKATGFPIARVAAKLAVGYTLDELPNAITQRTLAAFEPSIDYVVVKAPRWPFERFPEANDTLTTRMKSVGEAMAIGRTFKEAFQKALRSLENGRAGFGFDGKQSTEPPADDDISRPWPRRMYAIADAFAGGVTVERAHELTQIDPWFLGEMQAIAQHADRLRGRALESLTQAELRAAKQDGFSDVQLAHLLAGGDGDAGKGGDSAKAAAGGAVNAVTEDDVRARRLALDVTPVYKTIDTCAAEFEAFTPYQYSTYDDEDEPFPSFRPRVVILGSGPNRIGQGIEFDYCCVRACLALRELGFETVMINCNPETVSTDFDIADRLFFEPVTLEDVLNVCDRERPRGVVVQFGGQTPISLARALEARGLTILGTSAADVHRVEDRKQFHDVLAELGVVQPRGETAETFDEAIAHAADIGYPVLVRPSYVLGGRGMATAFGEDELKRLLGDRTGDSVIPFGAGNPLLIDEFLEDAFEYDVDAVADGEHSLIAGVMQHIEEAGVHSGDSACVMPPYHAPPALMLHVRDITTRLAEVFNIVGLMNLQLAVKENRVYVLEVNPRASRTVPFVSKATGVAWVDVAAAVIAGRKLADLRVPNAPPVPRTAVKEVVFPFNVFPEVDPQLGPEMKSTGEVMATAADFGRAFAKAEAAARNPLPESGDVFISVHDRDKPTAATIARRLHGMGFTIHATAGTAVYLESQRVPAVRVNKVHEGAPSVLDLLASGRFALMINTPLGRESHIDDSRLRTTALRYGVPYTTTLSAAFAAVSGIESLREGALDVLSLQEALALTASATTTSARHPRTHAT